jgi:hypothetical protein
MTTYVIRKCANHRLFWYATITIPDWVTLEKATRYNDPGSARPSPSMRRCSSSWCAKASIATPRSIRLHRSNPMWIIQKGDTYLRNDDPDGGFDHDHWVEDPRQATIIADRDKALRWTNKNPNGGDFEEVVPLLLAVAARKRN